MQAIALQSIAALRAMTPDELDSYLRAGAKLAKAAKDEALANRTSNPAVGKAICILEERLNAAKSNRTIAMNTSLADYYEGVTRAKMPTHAMSCAVAFGLVRAELLPEGDYDKCSANMLELAGAIVNAVKGELTHAAIADTVRELTERSKDAPKNLRNILKRVKPAKPMTAEEAQDKLAAIIEDGHLHLVIASVGVEITHLEGDKAKDAYWNLTAAGVLVDKHFGEEQIDAWLAERARATAPVQLNPTAPSASAAQTEERQLQAAA